MLLRRRTMLVGAFAALAAAAGGVAAAATRAAAPRIPARLWVVALGPESADAFASKQAADLRAHGINALVAERTRLSELQIARIVRAAAPTKLSVLVAYS